MSDLTRLKHNLEQLSAATGVSGGESEVRKLVTEAIRDKVQNLTIDAMGSVTAVRKGSGASPLKVMVSAHMDETGFMVTSVDDKGLISVEGIGNHDVRMLPAQRLVVGKDKMPGVFLWQPLHKNHENKPIAVDEMHIDVGADSKGTIKPGERVGFSSTYTEMTPEIVRGKAFDSRAACAALIELIEGKPFPFDLQVAFTVQRAIGQRGAAVAAHRLAPQVACILIGVECNDLPRDPDDSYMPVVRLGGGPVLVMLEGRGVVNRRLIDHTLAVAAKHGIACQRHALGGTPSDADAISRSREGVPTLTIGIPIRYMSCPNALLNLSDLENTIRLLREALTALTPDFLER